MVLRFSKIALGSVLVLVGIIITPLPIPLGIISIILGLSLLVASLPKLRNKIRNQRAKYSEFSDRLKKNRHYLPGFAKKLVDDTEPNQPPR